MLTRILCTYLSVIALAHTAELLTGYSFAFFTVFTLAQVVGPALLCRCARKVGRKEGHDEGHIEGYIEGCNAAYDEIHKIAQRAASETYR